MTKSLHPGETHLSGYHRPYRTGPLPSVTPERLLLRETWCMASLRSKPIQSTNIYNRVVTNRIHSSGFRKDGLSNTWINPVVVLMGTSPKFLNDSVQHFFIYLQINKFLAWTHPLRANRVIPQLRWQTVCNMLHLKNMYVMNIKES